MQIAYNARMEYTFMVLKRSLRFQMAMWEWLRAECPHGLWSVKSNGKIVLIQDEDLAILFKLRWGDDLIQIDLSQLTQLN